MRTSTTGVTLAAVVIALIAPLAVAHPSSGIIVDPKGDIYFTDNGTGGDIIWKIDARGELTRFHKGGWHWLALDESGRFAGTDFRTWFDKRLAPNLNRVPFASGATALIQTDGCPLVIDRDGGLCFAKGNLEIVRLSLDGTPTTIAPNLKVTTEKLGGIKGLAAGRDGSLYASCPSAVLKVKRDGTVTTLVHPIVLTGVDTDVPAGTPEDHKPFLRGLAVDGRGTVYTAATGSRCVLKITPDGKAEAVLKAERPWSPTGVAADGEDVYVLEYANANSDKREEWRPRVRKLGRDGTVTILATITRERSGARPTPPSAPAAPPPARPELVLQAPPAVSVNSVTVSPDGSLVATAAGEGGVRLYDAKTGAQLRALGAVGDRSVVFSPDGRRLAAAGFHMDKLVGVFDVQTGKRMLALPGHREWEADATAISPDGKLLASTGTDKQILVWELATGKLRLQLKDQAFRSAALAFSPDSATLASGGGDKLVRLWDTTTGQLRRSFAGHGNWVAALAFAPDGKTIASGSCDWGFHRGHNWVRPAGSIPEQSEWRLWDVDTGKLLRVASEPGRMLSVAFAPGGKSLACGIDKDLRLYDLAAETAGRVVTSHDATITSVAFTPDGAAVISGSHDQTVKRTNLATGKVEWRAPGYFETVNSVALSRDGSLIATGSSDHRFASRALKVGHKALSPGAVRLWDARTGRLLRRQSDAAEQIMAVALSPDGRRVASGGASAAGSGVVRVWEAATGKSVWSQADHTAEVLAIAFAPDGSSMATAADDGLVKLRDPATGKVTRTLEGHQGGATSVAFSADGTLLVCGEGYGATRIWDVGTGRLLRTCQAAGSRAGSFTGHRLVNSIGLSQDGGTLATSTASMGDFTEPVKIWDARTGAHKRDFADEGIRGQPMALAPDGSILATGGKSIKLWDVRSGKLLCELFGHLKRTQSIVFSADGRFLVAGGSYGTTNIWEVATGRHLVTLFAFPTGRDGPAADDWLAYHPDGYYDGSPGVEKYLGWRVGDEFRTPATFGVQLHRPDRIVGALTSSNPGPR